MKKALALIISVLFVFAVASISFAAEEKKAEPAPMEMKDAKKVKQVTGEVAAVDVKAKTVTVKGKKSDITAVVDDKTKIMMDKEVKTIADLKAGDKVTLKYSDVDGKMIAKSIAIKPVDKMMEKKAEPAARPAEKK